MEMGESLKRMLGVADETPAPTTFANSPVGQQDTARSEWRGPALLQLTGAVAEKAGEVVQDAALAMGASVPVSAGAATVAENVFDPLNITGAGKGVAAAGMILPAAWKHANQPKIVEALKLEKLGTAAEEIFSKLGIYRGPIDKQWRYVVDDTTSVINETMFTAKRGGGKAFLPPEGKAVLGDILEHPSLYKEIPELRGIAVYKDFKLKHGEAVYYHNPPRIVVNSFDNINDAHSAILHEIQHSVQDRAGFIGGGSPELFLKDPVKYEGYLDSLRSHKERMKSEITSRYPNFVPYKKQQPDAIGKDPIYQEYMATRIEIDMLEKNLEDAHVKYKHLAGEAEARVVERMWRKMHLLKQEGNTATPFPMKEYTDVDTSKLIDNRQTAGMAK